MKKLEELSIIEIKAAIYDCDKIIKIQQQNINLLFNRLQVLEDTGKATPDIPSSST